MQKLKKSEKLEDVCYDIRGPILEEAKRLEEEGYEITKLNIGNPAPFGLNAQDELGSTRSYSNRLSPERGGTTQCHRADRAVSRIVYAESVDSISASDSNYE